MTKIRIRRLYTGFLLLLLAFATFLHANAARADALPLPGEHMTDAVYEDFTGGWTLRWIRSEEAVDMSTYGYMDLYANGSVSVSFGNINVDHSYFATANDLGGGCIHVPGGEGFHDLYLHLTEDGLMVCGDQPENPGIAYYMEFAYDLEEDLPEEERMAQYISVHIGGQLFDVGSEDFEGEWKAFNCTDDEGDLFCLYQVGYEITLEIEGDQATMLMHNGLQESVYETPVIFEYDHAAILNEHDDDYAYLILCEDGRLAMVDDVAMPSEAIFFMTADEWAEEMEYVDYNANPTPGERQRIETIESLTGSWTATHVSLDGELFPTRTMGFDIHFIIEPDGRILMEGDEEYVEAEGRIEDDHLVITESDGYVRCIYLHQDDILIEAEDPDDFSYVVYYQRLD